MNVLTVSTEENFVIVSANDGKRIIERKGKGMWKTIFSTWFLLLSAQGKETMKSFIQKKGKAGARKDVR